MDMSNEARVTATFALPLDNITVQAPSPDLLSQRNVEAITGIPQRAFLETIRSPSFPLQVTKMGALRIVDRVAFVRWDREGARRGHGVDLGELRRQEREGFAHGCGCAVEGRVQGWDEALPEEPRGDEGCDGGARCEDGEEAAPRSR